MAILSGFPAANTISPGVRISEQDLTLITPTQSFHSAGLIGFASKGPINLPTLVTTHRDLNVKFGQPHPDVGDPFLIYAAAQYLLVANQLWCVRVADTDPVSDEVALVASIEVPAAGTLVMIESATAGPYTFDDAAFFRWRLNGKISSRMLVVEAGTYSVSELVAYLNADLDTEHDGIEFYVSNIQTIGVRSVWAYGPSASLELVSVQNSMYGGTVMGGNVTGLGTGMTQASVLGDVGMYPNVGYQTPGIYDFTGLTGLNLIIIVDGTDNVLIDQIAQTIDLSALEGSSHSLSAIVTAINNETTANGGSLPGGWEAVAVGNNLEFKTLSYGEDARLRIKPDSTAAAIFGLDTLTHIGTSPSGTTGDVAVPTYGIVYGDTNNDGSNTFLLMADSPGIEGNQTQVVIANNASGDNFTMQIFNNGVAVESWGNLTKDQTSSFYISTYLSLVSNYIRVSDNTDDGAGPLAGTYTLSGGSDGIPADPDAQDHLLIGSNVGYTGVYTLSQPDQINIDLVAVPGHSSTAVVMAMLDMVENYRGDCLALVDPPFGLTVNEIIAWQNGTHPLNGTRFDSNFAALYWPWVKIADSFNGVDVWVPPSGSIMAVIATSDYLSAPWFAPAGVNRGIVPAIEDVYTRPTLSERDSMYSNANCINPIIQFSDGSGFIVWGQKTLQRAPTALDRVNVRRLMFFLEKSIAAACKKLVFDPNDSIFQAKFTQICKGILDPVVVGRGIYDYKIVADKTLNTPQVIAENSFYAQIGVQPTYAAEFLFIEFSLFLPGSFTTNA